MADLLHCSVRTTMRRSGLSNLDRGRRTTSIFGMVRQVRRRRDGIQAMSYLCYCKVGVLNQNDPARSLLIEENNWKGLAKIIVDVGQPVCPKPGQPNPQRVVCRAQTKGMAVVRALQ